MCTGCLTGQCHPDLLGKQGPGRRRRPRTPPPRGKRRRGCAPGSRRPTPPRPSWRPPGGSWRRRKGPRRPSWALLGSRRRRRRRPQRPRRPPREPRTRAAPSATMRRRARGTRSKSRRALAQQEGPFSPCVLSYIRGERLPEPQALAGHALRCEALQRMRAGPRPACHAMPSLAVAEICRTCRAAAWSCVLRAARERRCGTSDAQRSGCKTSGFAATSCNKDLPKAHSARPRMH